MRKICLLSTVFTLSVILLSAHSTIAQDWRFGIKGGINFARLNFDGGNDPDGKIGVHVGVFGNTPINADGNLFIQPELLFSLQGREDVNLSYLILPVVLKYYLIDQLSIHGGLQPGLLIGAEDDNDEVLTTLDLGVPIGAEFDIDDTFGVGLRYVVGATNIFDPDGDTDLKIYNRVFQLFASYRFP